MVATRPGDDPTPRAGEGGPRRTTAQLASDPAFTTTYARVVALAGTGVDLAGAADSATAIQALIAANPGAYFRGVPGSTYKLASALTLSSGSTLDMTGCTVTLAADANTYAVTNSAITPTSTVTGVGISASGSAVTGSGFTNALDGTHVSIAGAGLSGGPLYGRFTYTNATTGAIGPIISATPTSAIAATGTVAAATMSAYGRDSNITVVGGRWIRTANVGAVVDGLGQHLLVFRRVDRLTVRNVRVESTDGKYAISVGDCTDVTIDSPSFNTKSDGVHIQGACQDVNITNVHGTTLDDMVSITAQDYWNTGIKASFNDVSGDVLGVTISGVFPSGSATAVKVLGGGQCLIRGLLVRNVIGDVITRAISIPDDSTGASNVSVVVDGLRVKVGDAYPCIFITATAAQHIAIKNWTPVVPSTYTTTNNAPLLFGGSASVQSLVLDGVANLDVGADVSLTLVPSACSIADFTAHDVQWRVTANNDTVNVFTVNGTVTRMKVSDSHAKNCKSMLIHGTGAAALKLLIANTTADNLDHFVQLGSTNGATVELSNNDLDCFGSYVRSTAASGTVEVHAASVRGLRVSTKGVVRTSTATVKVYDLAMPADLADLNKFNGGLVNNVNSGLTAVSGTSAGLVGPCVCDGTNWHNLASGATY